MRILLVSTQDYIHHPVPSRHHYIFEELAKRHEVHVAHFHVSEGKERKTRLVVHEATKYSVKNPAIHYLLNAPHHYKVFKKIMAEENIDIVVASHVLAGTAVIKAAKKYDVPVLFDIKDWYPNSAAAYYNNSIIKWTLRNGVWQILRHNLKMSDRITAMSPSVVERLKSRGFQSTLITNGVDTDYFKPMDAAEGKKRLGLDEDLFVMGFAGSLEKWYALDEVIKKFSETLGREDDSRLLIVGGSLFTDYEEKLKKLTKDLGLDDKVIFTGLAKYRDLPKYISAMDLCLIPFSPSPDYWIDLIIPNKYFEYSACGRPILSSPIKDMMEIGGDHLFIYRNMDEFMDKVLEIKNGSREFKVDMGSYSWKKKAEEMEEVLENIVAGKDK